MGVEKAEARAGHEVGAHEVQEQSGLAGARLAAEIKMPTAVGEEERNALAGRERSENVIVVGHGFVCIGWPPCRAECSCVLYELQSVSDGQPMHTTGASGSGAPAAIVT